MEALVRSGVFEASLAVFHQWVTLQYAKYGDGVLTTAMLRNTADMRSFGSMLKERQAKAEQPVFGDRNSTFVYPIMGMTIGSIAVDTHKAGLKPQQYTKGQMIGKSLEKNEAYFESRTPVKVTIGATLETDNLDHVLAYVTMLFEARPRVTLLLKSEDTGFTTQIGVAIDSELTIPQADFGTPGDPYKFEHTFTIDTYLGVASKMPLIRSVNVQASVGTRGDSSEFDVDDLAKLQLMTLRHYELFDKAHPNYRYDYEKERGQ